MANGCWPVRSSNATTPSAQQSAAGSAFTVAAPRSAATAISGAAYTRADESGAGAAMAAARSKSVSIQRFSCRRWITCAGFMLPWT